MKKLLATVSGLAISLSTVGVVFAAGPSNATSAQTMVFVGSDVTQQDHFSWTFRRPLSGGGQQSVTMNAPLGSLFKFHETTRSNAIAKHELYVPVQGDAAQQMQEMIQLSNLLKSSEGIAHLSNFDPFALKNVTSNLVTDNVSGSGETNAVAATGSDSAEGNFYISGGQVYDDFTVYYNPTSATNTSYVTPTNCNEHLSAQPSVGPLTEDGFSWEGVSDPTSAQLSTSIDYNTLSYGPGASGSSFYVLANDANNVTYLGSQPLVGYQTT